MQESYKAIKSFLSFILLSLGIIFIDILFSLNFIKEKSIQFIYPITYASQNLSNEIKDFVEQLTETKKIYKEYVSLIFMDNIQKSLSKEEFGKFISLEKTINNLIS